jgi:hypothetical protein
MNLNCHTFKVKLQTSLSEGNTESKPDLPPYKEAGQKTNAKLKTQDNKRNDMTRNELIKRLGRYILLMLIALIAISLGKKVSGANECSTCAGKGICNGKTDCKKY